jgi:hypothetical protein
MDRDAVEELKALLDEAGSPEVREDETVRAFSGLTVERISRSRPPRNSERPRRLTDAECDALDRAAGAPLGTMRGAWRIARSRRARS